MTKATNTSQPQYKVLLYYTINNKLYLNHISMKKILAMVRAKGDQIVSTSASSNAGRIIISIRVSLRTSRLEDLRIRSRLA